MQVQQVDIEVLAPYAFNARTHSAAQVEQIANSITEFGFNNPVLIDKQKGIIAGHGRVLAARQLGLKKIPTITLKHLTEQQRKAFILADNKIALNSGWNHELLQVELGNLSDEGFDLELLGFDDFNLEEPEAEHSDPSYGGATSMSRGSAPLKVWRAKKLLKGKVLDFGCGQDVHEFTRYDAFTCPDVSVLRKSYDTVMCNYVVNVQPSDHLITEIVCLLSKLIKPGGTVLIAAVNSRDLDYTDAAGGLELRSADRLAELIEPFFDDIDLIEKTKCYAFVCKGAG
jgi:hypothetical protein|tara:strand:- start:21054 stop:21908 length:855 start_codon:yes stop_codon:yes gene_type:complete